MNKRFELYWLRESGRDWGTPVDAEDLDPAIQERVLDLAGDAAGDVSRDNPGPLHLHLPFLDRRESRRRAEILRGLTLEREGDVIRGVAATRNAALRDHAATLLARHPAWTHAPDEFHHRYFQTWQKVSVALQRALRQWIPEVYFHDPARYEDREAAYSLLVYEAGRVCHGRPRTEFTYDIADPETMPCAMNMIASALQGVLKAVERRLHESGKPELARRYAPVWHQDVLRAVRNKPRPLMALLGDEAVLINAVIDLGTARSLEAVKPFARVANLALRHMYGEDLRPLAARALQEATKALESASVERTASSTPATLTAGFNRPMRQTAPPVVWDGDRASLPVTRPDRKSSAYDNPEMS